MTLLVYNLLFYGLPLITHLLQPWHFYFCNVMSVLNSSCNIFFYTIFNEDLREIWGIKKPATTQPRAPNRNAILIL